MTDDNDTPTSDDEFTNTELMMIALVLNQNAEQYGGDDNTETRKIKRLATKARKMMSTNEDTDD